MCLLDSSSGAAISVRSFLEAAAAAGIRCESFTASLFDPARELNLQGILGARANDSEAIGKRVIVERSGVHHSVFRTKQTQSKHFSLDEQKAFENSWVNWLRKNRPKVVVTYGGSPFTLRLQDHARRLGSQIVYYLGNAEYEKPDFYRAGDIVLTPSNFLRDHYRTSMGIESRVLRTVIKKDRLDLVTVHNSDELDLRRRKGFVTFMTPIPHKGLTLFDAIARLVFRELPEIKFLVTEGRSSREWLARQGYDLSQRPNIWYMATHEDVRSIFERTSMLLVPSFWKEGFGRNIVEAQLSGIPVLANNRGGIAEALNGSGFLYEAPPECVENYMNRPDRETVGRWREQIETLFRDGDVYRQASLKAVEAAKPFHPDTTSGEAVILFRELLAG